jgi:hypothetical protein
MNVLNKIELYLTNIYESLPHRLKLLTYIALRYDSLKFVVIITVIRVERERKLLSEIQLFVSCCQKKKYFLASDLNMWLTSLLI